MLRTVFMLGTYSLVGFVLSLVGTRIAIAVLPCLGYIDKPGGRHIHKNPVPRGGGIAVIIAFFAALAAYVMLQGGSIRFFMQLFIPGTVLAILGLIDDRIDLPALLKLIVQIGCAVAVYLISPVTIKIFGYQLHWAVALGFTVAWVILIINAFNLIDGMDGLASGVAVISSICLGLWLMLNHKTDQMMATLILAGCCFGFLCFNFHPAKIFLGDVGSTFLGLVFAVIGLNGVDSVVTVTSMLIPLLALGVPVFDVILAVWRRVVRKLLNPKSKGIMDGDQDHLHHRVLRFFGKQRSSAFFVYAIAIIFSLLSLMLVVSVKSIAGISFAILAVGMVLTVRHLALPEMIDSIKYFGKGIAKPHNSLLANVFHPLFDLAVLTMAIMFTDAVFNVPFDSVLFLIIVCSMFASFFIAGMYNVYWLRAGIADYYHLFLSVICGFVVSIPVVLLLVPEKIYDLQRVNIFIPYLIVLVLIVANVIVGERFLLGYVESFWLYKLTLSRFAGNGPTLKTAVLGGGIWCSLFIKYQYSINWDRNVRYEIVGIIDDNPVLKKQRVHGFRILGQSKDLEEIYARSHFECLIVTVPDFEPEKIAGIKKFCQDKNIELRKFNVEEKIETLS